jgi:YD repeat-containing protein
LTNGGYRLERRNGTTYTYNPNGQLIHQRNNQWKK